MTYVLVLCVGFASDTQPSTLLQKTRGNTFGRMPRGELKEMRQKHPETQF